MRLYKTFKSFMFAEYAFISIYVSDLEDVYLSTVSFMRIYNLDGKSGYRHRQERNPLHQSDFLTNKQHCESYLTERYLKIEECKTHFVDPSGALRKVK